jgi:hypothetical protein
VNVNVNVNVDVDVDVDVDVVVDVVRPGGPQLETAQFGDTTTSSTSVAGGTFSPGAGVWRST